MRHFVTWLSWVNKMSPMSPSITNTTLEERESMATALAMAAPDGPAGFACVDVCRCHDKIPDGTLVRIYERLIEKGFRPPGDAEASLMQIREALLADFVRARPEIPVLHLTEIGVVVSHFGSAVAAARAQFPRTWQVISAR